MGVPGGAAGRAGRLRRWVCGPFKAGHLHHLEGVNICMWKTIFAAVLAIMLTSGASAQALHDHSSGLAHGIPDLCAAEPTATIVAAGQARTFSGPAMLSCLGIHGAVTFAPDLVLSAVTVLVYDDGSLTVSNGAKVTFKDAPFDLALDPEQYGHGLVVLGTLRVNGAVVTAFVKVTSDILAGATTLTLPAPADWKVGHRLWVPDTHQVVASELLPGFPETNVAARAVDQSEVCTVVAVNALSVTCAAPMRFAHKGAHSPAMNGQPALDFYPDVANLTRGVAFRSENPTGVRGHLLVSQRADVQIRGASFSDMGRTRGVRLDSTTFNADGSVKHVGTNQIGRYTVHLHHVFGPATTPDPYQFVLADSVLDQNLKWGLSVHNTGWGLVQDNVCVVADGACFVTEDGDEVENTFDHNFGSSVENRHGTAEFAPLFTYDKDATGGTGIRGTTFWFKSMNSRVTRNVAYASRSCIAFYTGNAEDEVDPQVATHLQRIPKFRGADTTVDANVTLVQTFLLPMLPIDGNECVSMSHFGVELWWTQGAIELTKPSYPFKNLPIKNTTVWNVLAKDSSGAFPGAAVSVHYATAAFDGVRAISGNGGLFAVAVNDSGGMGAGPGASELAHVDARGFDYAWQHGGQLGLPKLWRFRDSFYQTVNGFQIGNFGELSTMEPVTDAFGNSIYLATLEWRNVKFSGQKSIQAVFNADTQRGLEGRRRIHLNVLDHNGVVGDNLRVYFSGQAPSAPAPAFRPKDPDAVPFDLGCPGGVALTNQQCWDQFHIATLMEVAPATTTLRADIGGLVGPLPVDPPEPEPAPGPGPAPQPGPLPPTCNECVTSITAVGDMWSLGAAHPAGGFVVRRNGVDTSSAGLGYILANDGFLFLYTANGGFYRWEPGDMFWNGPGWPKPTPASPPPPPPPPPPAQVDCRVSSWVDLFTPWVATDPLHEQRMHSRHRDIISLPLNGGAACPVTDEVVGVETRSVTPPPPPPVDCVVSAWSAWSVWAPVPGTTSEQRTRTRTVVTPPANNGMGCPAPLSNMETELRPAPVVTTWACTVPTAVTVYANGDKKLTVRCPKTATVIKGDHITVAK